MLEAALGEWSSFPVLGRVWRCSLTLQGKNKQEKKNAHNSIEINDQTTIYNLKNYLRPILRVRERVYVKAVTVWEREEEEKERKIIINLFGVVKRYISGSIMRNKITLRLDETPDKMG